MHIETERRFTLRYLPPISTCIQVRQVYRRFTGKEDCIEVEGIRFKLNAPVPAADFVRLRIMDGNGFLTFKTGSGMHREEHEFNVPADRIEGIIASDRKAIIKKRCLSRDYPDILIDAFEGDSEGVLIAEIERELIANLPVWIANEITHMNDLTNMGMYMNEPEQILILYRSYL